MSFIITLDTNAVDKLFSEESGGRVTLRQAVIAELVKRVMPRNTSPEMRREIDAAIKEVQPELMSLLRDEHHINHILRDRMNEITGSLRNTVIKTTPESSAVVREIDERVKKLISGHIEERLGGMTKLVDDAVDRVSERITANMDRWIDERVDARIQAEVDARIQRMRDAL